MRIELEFNGDLGGGAAQAAYIQAAIDDLAKQGGGTLSIGPGCYSTTTLFLRSDIELHLQRGCIIQAHHDLKDYPTVDVRGALNKDQSAYHLIVANECHDIAIRGEGIIDGQDEVFWEPCPRVEDRPYGIFRFTPKKRPSPLVQLVKCKNVKLADFTVRAAPGWALHIFECDTVSVFGVTVRGHKYGPHTDGIGINGSRDVLVSHCDVDTGDDAIIIKATNTDSVCERVAVSNCVLASNCAAMGLGADVEGVIRDVVFSNCVVKKSLRMIQVEMWFPGQVERACFSGISGSTFPDDEVENERPIYVDIQQFKRSELTLGKVSDIIFRDILCESRGRIMMTAQDGSVLDGITLDSVTVIVPEVEDPHETIPRATSLQLSNFSPETRGVRAGVIADNVHRLTLRNVEYRWPEDSATPMAGLCMRKCSDVIDDSPRLTSSESGVDRTLEIGS